MAATHPGLRCASLTARVRDPGSDFLCTRQGTGPRCARLPSTPPDTKLAGPLRTLGSLGPQAPPGNQTLTERGGLNGSANHRHHLQFSKGRHGTWQYGSHLHRTDGLPAAPNNDCHAPPPPRPRLRWPNSLVSLTLGLGAPWFASHLSLPSSTYPAVHWS